MLKLVFHSNTVVCVAGCKGQIVLDKLMIVPCKFYSLQVSNYSFTKHAQFTFLLKYCSVCLQGARVRR